MPITEATITGVVSRVGNRKSDNKPFTVYEVQLDSDPSIKYQTFNRSIANEVNRLLNTRAEVQFHTEQRGNYENYYIDDVREASGSNHYSPNEIPQAPQSRQEPQQDWRDQQSQQYTAEIPQAPQDGSGTVKDWSVWRQVACKVSAVLSHTPAEFWSNVDDLVDYFHTGIKPMRFTNFVPPEQRDMSRPVPQGQAQPAPGNQYVPEAAYAEADSYTHTDDDIPF